MGIFELSKGTFAVACQLNLSFDVDFAERSFLCLREDSFGRRAVEFDSSCLTIAICLLDQEFSNTMGSQKLGTFTVALESKLLS